MGLRDRWREIAPVLGVTSRDAALTVDDYAQLLLNYNGVGYGLGGTTSYMPPTTLGEKVEEIGSDYMGIAQGAYKQNGVVFACMLLRQMVFSEARFKFRRQVGGRPGELFGTPALARLEQPYAGGTTADLLSRMIQDVDLAGNAYVHRRPTGVARLRPDWVYLILGVQPGRDEYLDVEVVGYLYCPGGRHSGIEPIPLLPEEVCHFAPMPDPQAMFRGMSWLTPIIREIMGDRAATAHKLKFFENGATSNIALKFPPELTAQQVGNWVEKFETKEGLANAYKTLYVGGGADLQVIGANMRQIDFKNTQGGGETRICMAAGVPPILVGSSEGLQASTYTNFPSARRRFADGTIRPLWRNLCGSMQRIVTMPQGSAELWYDDRDIPFIAEDQKDSADIHSVQAGSINTLIMAGFEADSAVDAVVSGDLTRLKHSGLLSVQMQAPGESSAPPAAPPPPSGNGAAPAPSETPTG